MRPSTVVPVYRPSILLVIPLILQTVLMIPLRLLSGNPATTLRGDSHFAQPVPGFLEQSLSRMSAMDKVGELNALKARMPITDEMMQNVMPVHQWRRQQQANAQVNSQRVAAKRR